jgi:hypothetical protein
MPSRLEAAAEADQAAEAVLDALSWECQPIPDLRGIMYALGREIAVQAVVDFAAVDLVAFVLRRCCCSPFIDPEATRRCAR